VTILMGLALYIMNLNLKQNCSHSYIFTTRELSSSKAHSHTEKVCEDRSQVCFGPTSSSDNTGSVSC
jgi:hypothetical protein